MSMRQSVNIDLRRNDLKEDASDGDGEEEECNIVSPRNEKKHFLSNKLINTNIKSKPSANALTPSKIQEQQIQEMHCHDTQFSLCLNPYK